MSVTPSRRAFTLVELLSVIAIIGTLSALIIGGLARARLKTNQLHCLSNLRQVGVALMLHANDHRGLLPHNSLVTASSRYTRTGKRSLGHHLAAYLDQRPPETLGNEEGLLSQLLCAQRLADNPADTGAHFIVQCTMAGSRTYSNGTNRPFGTDSAEPIRYAELNDFGGPARVWALMEADQRITGTGWGAVTGSGWFQSLPPTPGHGASRVVLYFDGGARLMRDLPARPR